MLFSIAILYLFSNGRWCKLALAWLADCGEHRQAAGAVARNAGQVLMSALGGKARTSARFTEMSAFGGKADIREHASDVRLWHKADIAAALSDVRFWG